MPENPYTENVKRGATLLNKECPGWREEIDLSTLNLPDCDSCILGQIYGSYETGLSFLWDYNDELEGLSIAHGFIVDLVSRPHQWRLLREAWIAELREQSACREE